MKKNRFNLQKQKIKKNIVGYLKTNFTIQIEKYFERIVKSTNIHTYNVEIQRCKLVCMHFKNKICWHILIFT